ncbi:MULTISPECIES: hypothetical protein [Geodermatophilaceae]|uniref:hypothetical protein n=1 Tax=Geodermatophilaceae TaxID=85030 RepID=UPI0010741551|nr:hypothetical protein [Blastococcus sp. TF02A_35]TFV52090.1 hypothetical protein E4P43_07560 [Blastococcus sp. TF02A_35]
MGTASTNAAAEPAGDPTAWTDVVSAVGAGVAAFAALATVVVAIVAARYAKGQVDGLRKQLDVAGEQLEEARTLRREQAQPYVVVSAVTNRVSPHVSEVVIQNLGTTGARDVTISCSPPLVRTDQHGGAQEVQLPETIPFMAPGQEWRTFWDVGTERARDIYDLPDRYDVTVTYRDSLDVSHTTPSVLDWGVFRHRMWTTEKTVHHATKELEAIRTALQSLAGPRRVQRVAVFDGPQLDRDAAEAEKESMRHLAELDAEVEQAQVRWQREHEGEQ